MRRILREFTYYLTYHAKLNLVVTCWKSKIYFLLYYYILTGYSEKHVRVILLFLTHYIIFLNDTVDITQYAVMQSDLHAECYIDAITNLQVPR